MATKGRFRLNWETSLPCFHAVDEADPTTTTWASYRIYEISWFGYTVSWRKQVNRPLALAKRVEPWEWLDTLYHLFKKGF